MSKNQVCRTAGIHRLLLLDSLKCGWIAISLLGLLHFPRKLFMVKLAIYEIMSSIKGIILRYICRSCLINTMKTSDCTYLLFLKF